MKTYEAHLWREIVAATLLVLAAFVSLFAFFDFIHELESLGKGGYDVQDAALYIALTLPGRAYEIMPIAVLIGALYALTLLARHAEITVLRSSGLSTAALLGTLGKIGIVFAAATFLLGEFVAPPAERAGQALRLAAKSQLVGQEFRSGLWVKDGQTFINVSEVLPDASLRGVRVFAFDADYRLKSLSEAASGRYASDRGWELSGVVQTHFETDGPRIERHVRIDWRSALTPDILAVLMVSPERMSLMNLYSYIQHLSENKQKTQRYEIAWWKKLVYPLATLVMLALALPFALGHERMTAVSVKVFAGVMLGIFFHMLNGLFSHLGMINGWRPVLAAVAPSVTFLFAAAVMLWWVERR